MESNMTTENQLVTSILLRESWLVPSILGAYAALILIDSQLLKSRKPLDLKWLMMMFNIYQIFYNFYMFYLCANPESLKYFYNTWCYTKDTSSVSNKFLSTGIMFVFSKLIDLIDTLFIVLRKKHNQISFLHLYHHAGMVSYSWIVLKDYMGEQLLVIVLVNSFVHTVMYTYYTLSLWGASIQKHLWWKKYVTLLQMGQFLVFIVYFGALVYNDCSWPKGLSFFVITQAIIFFKLFKDFYDRKYQGHASVTQLVDSRRKSK